MNSDSDMSVERSSPIQPVNQYIQLDWQDQSNQLQLKLPTQAQLPSLDSWSELWPPLKYRLEHSEVTWPPETSVSLIAQDQLLDGVQLQQMDEALQTLQLKLQWVHTNRRQTAVAAATAGYSVQQTKPESLTAEAKNLSLNQPLYLKHTVRSGVEIRHEGSVIVLGDLNPGGKILAAGDILIWGSLRGIVHAGALGDRERCIMALQMQAPTQLRIAEVVATVPATSVENEPEVAYVSERGIRLARATKFLKTHFFAPQSNSWQDRVENIYGN